MTELKQAVGSIGCLGCFYFKNRINQCPVDEDDNLCCCNGLGQEPRRIWVEVKDWIPETGRGVVYSGGGR